MKTIAMYLPQFHRVRENDIWWGEGFTEWTTVKNANKQLEQQTLPRIPLNSNYYDLENKNVMEWQASLMKKYSIDGMCLYHYWFENGKQILEKPANNLLAWKDIDMPFCFCWANQTWARTWSHIKSANTWADKYENGHGINDEGILLRQSYGEKNDWIEHFEYLLPFFRDNRYIHINNRPIFLLYCVDQISVLRKMKEEWNRCAKKHGLEPIFFMGINPKSYAEEDIFDAIVAMSPDYTLKHMVSDNSGSNRCRSYVYDDVWERTIISNYNEYKKRVYLSGFVEYDDTPRRGENGICIWGGTPNKFEQYMKKLMKKSEDMGNDIIFVNAWNEWGETMYLEPDELHGYGYLQALKVAKETYMNAECNDMQGEINILMKEVESLKIKNAQYYVYWTIMDKMLTLKEMGYKFSAVLHKRGYRTVAVYGMGMLGNHLVKELELENLVLSYGIDKRKESKRYSFPIYSLDDDLPEVDVIVISISYAYEEIEREIHNKMSCDIIDIACLLEV